MNLKKTALAMSIAMVLSSEQLAANPNGAQVVHGSASFSNPTASELNVTNSHNAIINWQQFGIGAGETTRFIQPSAASAVLNRVVGNNASHILGNLHSNGRVFLINQNGILIGQGAHIDTAGFFGSTLNITDDDFLNGRLHFEGGGLGDIENHGYIHAGQGGNIVLIAPNIENGGVLEVEDGNVILAAGKSITITSLENSDIAFEVSAAEHQVVNLGQIIAHKGSASLFAKTLNHSGHIRANGLVRDADGTIRLVATDSNEISGEVIAEGGKIHVLGDTVTVKDGARIDASSANGGGEILIGGDQQGLNPEIQNATSTTIEQGARVRADATDNGNGGRVIVFAENDVHVHGEVSAKGGPNGGDGGFIETSGLRELDITNVPVASSFSGNPGEWLIDPNNILIINLSSQNISGNPNFVSIGDSAVLNTADIVAALEGGTSVTISTGAGGSQQGVIIVGSPIIAGPFLSSLSLTLNAHESIFIDADITTSNANFNLILNPDSDSNGSGFIRFNNVDILPGRDVTLNGDSVVSGDLILQNGFSTWNVNGTMTIEAGATFGITASTSAPNISGSGSIVNNGVISSNTSCSENDDCNPTRFNIGIVNNPGGQIQVLRGVMLVRDSLVNSGLINIQVGGLANGLHIAGFGTGSLTNNSGGTFSAVDSATLEIDPGTQFLVNAPTVIPSGMILDLNDSEVIINGSQLINRGEMTVINSVDIRGNGGGLFQNEGKMTLTLEQNLTTPITTAVVDTNTLTFNNLGEILLEAETVLDLTSDASVGTLVLPVLSHLGGAGTVVGNVVLEGGGIMGGFGSPFSNNTLAIDGILTVNSGAVATVVSRVSTPSSSQIGANSIVLNGGDAIFYWDEAGSLSNPGGNGEQFVGFLDCPSQGCVTGPGFETIVDPIGVLLGEVLPGSGASLSAKFGDALSVTLGNTVLSGQHGLTYQMTTLDPNRSVVSWTGSARDNNWNNPQNWNPDRLPGAGDYVFLHDSGNATISLTASTPQIAGLQLNSILGISSGRTLNTSGDIFVLDNSTTQSGALFIDGGTINPGGINGGGVLYNLGPTLALNGGSIQMDVVNWSDIDAVGPGVVFGGNLANPGLILGGHNITVNGNFDWRGGTVNGNGGGFNQDGSGTGFTTNGVTTVTSGILNTDWRIGPSGVVNWGGSNSDIFDVGDSAIINQGAFNVSSFPSATRTGPLQNSASAAATSSGSLTNFLDSLPPSGQQSLSLVNSIEQSEGFFLTSNQGVKSEFALRNLPATASFVNLGQLSIDAAQPGQSADTVIFRLNFINNGGDIIIQSGSFSLNGQPLTLDQSTESLQGFGTFIGNVINSAGLVSPGLTDSATGVAQTGTLTIQGNYTQGANGTMSFKLDATGASLLHDVLNVTGQVAADGAVVFSLVNGTTAERVNQLIGPDFSPLRFGSFSGTFSSVQIPAGVNIVFNPDGTFGVGSATAGDPQRDLVNSLLAGLFESELLNFDDLVLSMSFIEGDGEFVEEDDEKKKLGGRLVCK